MHFVRRIHFHHRRGKSSRESRKSLSKCYYATVYCPSLPFATSSTLLLKSSFDGDSYGDDAVAQLMLSPASIIAQMRIASKDWVSTVLGLCYLVSLLGVFTYRSTTL